MKVLPAYNQGSVLGGEVLVVRAGNCPVRNLKQPIRLTFKHSKQVKETSAPSHQDISQSSYCVVISYIIYDI